MMLVKKILVTFFLISTISYSFAEETIRITSGEWPPYLSQDLKYDGFVSRIIVEAFKAEKVTVEFGFFPWSRSFHLAKEGEWDGSSYWFRQSEREKYFYYSDPVVDVQYVFFHLKDYSFDWNTIEDLKRIRIGATLGNNYGEDFQKAEKLRKIMVSRVPKEELNFRKLLSGRIKVFPLDLDVGYSMIQKNFPPDKIKLFTHHPKVLRKDPGYLILSKKVLKNKRMLKLFNQGLKRLRESGKIDQYLMESRRGDYMRK